MDGLLFGVHRELAIQSNFSNPAGIQESRDHHLHISMRSLLCHSVSGFALVCDCNETGISWCLVRPVCPCCVGMCVSTLKETLSLFNVSPQKNQCVFWLINEFK